MDTSELEKNIHQVLALKKEIDDLSGHKKALSDTVLSQLDALGIEKFETEDGSVRVVNKYSFENAFSDQDKELIDDLDAQLKSAQQDAIAKCEAEGMIAELKNRYPVFSIKKEEKTT